jgi:2-octaprenyl-6-methoxyphenol hydroxylase
MSVTRSPPVDVAIVGGGLVGASLALALAGTSRSVVLIEAVPFDGAGQPSFDERTSALGNGSRRIFETLGVWAQLAVHAGAVREIRVSEAGRVGGALLSAVEQQLDALGYVVPNRHIGAALWAQLAQHPQVQIICPARVLEVSHQDGAVQLGIGTEAQTGLNLCARLAVAADGAHSVVRSASGIGALVEDYDQVALVMHVRTDRPAAGVAYERFTPTGPLAVLPLPDGRYTVVWTLRPERAAKVQALTDADCLAELQACLGWRIGRIQQVGKRAGYPLRLSRAESLVGRRTVLVGNAAQALHPVAGQGFNLGLRDAAMLAETIAAAPDPGAPGVLENFSRRRAADRRGMIAFTDGLIRLFGSDLPIAAAARHFGLQLFDLAPVAKRALARVSWGFGAEAPRLERGLSVS